MEIALKVSGYTSLARAFQTPLQLNKRGFAIMQKCRSSRAVVSLDISFRDSGDGARLGNAGVARPEDERDLLVELSENADVTAIVFFQFAGRAAGTIQPCLDGAGIFPCFADDERRVLDYFRENPAGTISGLSAMLGMPQRSVERLVAKLKKDGKLVCNGSARSGSWTVAP